MNVNGVPSQASIAIQTHKKAHSVTEEIPVEAEETQDVEGTESEDGAKGLLNLIQNGDFKPTPDIRHRINYLRQSTNKAFSDFKQTVEDQVADLKDSDLLDEDQIQSLDDFLSGLQGPKKEILGPDGVPLQDLISSWDDILSGLVGSADTSGDTVEPQDESPVDQITATDEEPATTEPEVEEQQTPAEPYDEQPVEEGAGGTDPQADVQGASAADSDIEPPVDTGTTTEEPEASPADPLGELVSNFQNNLQQILDQYKSDLDTFSTLPAPLDSVEHGNAYAKFLDIYTSMQPHPETESSEEGSLDVEETIVPEETESLS